MAENDKSGPTLTSVTYVSRQAVKYGSIILVSLMVGRVLFNAFVAYWKATHPEPPPPPTVGFGILPELRFDFKSTDEKPSSYTLETASGGIPDFGDRAKVYFMPKVAASLLADEEAKEVAATYNFVFQPEVLGVETYRWTKTNPIQSNLEMNIRNMSFLLSTNYLSHPEFLVNSTAPSGADSTKKVKDFLDRAELLPEDTASASGKVSYLKSLGGDLSSAVSQSDADFTQIDINRIPIDLVYEMYTPNGNQGVISAILTGAMDGADSIVELEYNHHPVDYEQYHTYPIRTGRSAWQLLQAGEGYIASKGRSENAVIRNVYLGYYDDFEEQEYLQPIYVFENKEDGFLGYVSAVDPQYIQK